MINEEDYKKHLKILRGVLEETGFGCPTKSDGFLFIEVDGHMKYLRARVDELKMSLNRMMREVESALGYEIRPDALEGWVTKAAAAIRSLSALAGEEGSIVDD